MVDESRRQRMEQAQDRFAQQMSAARAEMDNASREFRRTMDEARERLEGMMSAAKAQMEEARREFESAMR